MTRFGRYPDRDDVDLAFEARPGRSATPAWLWMTWV